MTIPSWRAKVKHRQECRKIPGENCKKMPRKVKTQDNNPYESIRGMWEGAYVAQFLRLFQCKFDFLGVTTQEFEEALVDSDCLLIADISARLIRYLTGKIDILINNFEYHFKQLVIAKHFEGNPLLESGASWSDISPEDKLYLLKWLVDHVYQEKEEDLMEYLDDNFSPDDLRGICAGQDAFNNLYWYLDDLRLYRENSVKKPNKKDWECVCLTLNDWQSFLKQFRKTSNPQERELYSYLNDELFPLIEGQLQNINDRESRNFAEKNSQLLQREKVFLDKMIKENKGKKEMSNSNIKSEPDMDSSCKSESDLMEDSENKTASVNETVNGPVSSTSMQPTIGPSIQANLGSHGNPNPGSESSCSNPSGNLPLSSTAGKNGSVLTPQEGSIAKPNEASCDDTCPAIKEELIPAPLDNLKDLNVSVDVKPSVPNACPMPTPSLPMPCAPIQTMPSPMINKQPSTMEAQYMQQQSQIFVFCTQLANKAAESVIQGQFSSIIAYHCSQPATKRFLEKHPLKVHQFSRQNPAAWLNNLAQMKQNRGPGSLKSNLMHNPMFGDHFMAGPGSGANTNWPLNQQTGMSSLGHNNWNMGGLMNNTMNNPMCNPMGASMNTAVGNPLNSPIGNPIGAGMCNSMGSPLGTQQYPSMSGQSPVVQQQQQQFPLMNQQGPPSGSPMMGLMNTSNPMSNMQQPSLAGVKVPDENLTPQQRQHREEQLAIIRNMHQLLFPDQHQGQSGSTAESNMVNQGIMPQQGGMMGQQGMMNQQQNVMGQQQNMMMQQDMMNQSSLMNQGQPGMMMSPQGPNSVSAISSPAGMNMMYSPSPGGGGVMSPGQPGSGTSFAQSGMMMPQQRMMSQYSSPQHASLSAQMEWQKLQQQFYDDRRRKHPQPSSGMQPQHPGQPTMGNLNNSMPGFGGPGPGSGVTSPGTRMQGPPPPYHPTQQPQTKGSASHPSPSPSSPSPASSSSAPPGSLSLPSPRMSSGLSSPADSSRQFPLPSNTRMPHPSPNSLQSTPLNSPNPRPMNPSNPGTPASIAPMPSPGLVRKPSQEMMQPSPLSDFGGSQQTSSSSSQPQQAQPCQPQQQAPVTPQQQIQQPSTPQQLQQPLTPQQSSNSQQAPLTPTQQQPSTPLQQPGTPQQSTPTSSQPSVPQTVNSGVSQPQPAEGMFGRTLQSYAQSSQQRQGTPQSSQSAAAQLPMQGPAGIKEPNLMPVPSPQQIQYLNTFEGQELTIQKQPNTSLRDHSLLSPSSISTTTMDNQSSLGPGVSLSSHDPMQPAKFPVTAVSTAVSGSLTPSSQISGRPLSAGPACISTTLTSGSVSAGPTCLASAAASTSGGLVMNVPSGSLPTSVSAMTPGPICDSIPPRYSGPGQPPAGNDSLSRFPVPSPQGPCSVGESIFQQTRFTGTPTGTMESIQQRFMGPRGGTNSNVDMMHPRFPGEMMQVGRFPGPNQNFSQSQMSQKLGGNSNYGQLSPSKMGPDMSSFGSGPGQLAPLGSGGNITPSPMPGQRLTHFDPISSMAQMSQSLGQGQAPAMMTNMTSMNMSSMQVSGGNNAQSNVVNFQTSMQSMQGVQQNMGNQSGPGTGQNSMVNQVGQNMAPGPQTVNNTYVNATMSIQQLNIQNVTTSPYNPTIQVQPMNPHPPMMQQLQGANTVSSSITMSPIMHSSVSPKSTSNMGMVMGSGPRGPQTFPAPVVGAQRIMTGSPTPRPLGGNIPYNGANIQVKASAPNTIQYLPARPQVPSNPPQRPPSLDFLQRFTSPLPGIDNKMPSHNLQYFPANQPQNMSMAMNMGGMSPQMNPSMNPTAMSPNIMSGMNSGPSTNLGPMGPSMASGPMARQPGVAAVMRGPGPQHSGNQMFGPSQAMPGEGPMFGGIPAQMIGGSGGPQMFGNKGQISPLGLTGEVAQPLAPGMSGSQTSGSFKQSPFMGPTTADPNYAQQFHNFQQQLYATNTRGNQINSQTSLSSGGSNFFGK